MHIQIINCTLCFRKFKKHVNFRDKKLTAVSPALVLPILLSWCPYIPIVSQNHKEIILFWKCSYNIARPRSLYAFLITCKKLILHIPAPLPQYPLLWSCSDPSRKALDHIYELLGIRKHMGCPKKTCQQKQQRKINELRYRMRLINAFLVIL